MTAVSRDSVVAAQIRAAGAVYHQAWVTHMIDNGLGAPHTITLDDHGLRLSLWPADAAKWVDSVTVTDETVTHTRPGLERVEVNALLPLLSIRVQLRFVRPAPLTHLAVV